MKKFVLVAVLAIFMAWAQAVGAVSMAELRLILSAGGSLVLELDNGAYTAVELAQLASALKYQATLTIRMGKSKRLTAAECAMIAKKRPGQVVFWF